MTRRPIDEELLTDFLLGNLPEEEIERLDEMSLADDDFAHRLQQVENDLVDAYVRGELSGTSLARFKSNYLKTQKRQEKVAFAEALQKQTNKTVFASHRSDFQWGFAAAAVIILLLGGYLIFENLRLQNQVKQMQAEQKSFHQHEQQLQKQIAQLKHQPGNTKTDEVKLLAYVLMPQVRGISKIPLIHFPADIDFLALTLKVETNDFPNYNVILKDPASEKTIWQSEKLTVENDLIQINVPANLFKPQNYLMELVGIPTNGTAEIVGSYPFRIAIQ